MNYSPSVSPLLPWQQQHFHLSEQLRIVSLCTSSIQPIRRAPCKISDITPLHSEPQPVSSSRLHMQAPRASRHLRPGRSRRRRPHKLPKCAVLPDAIDISDSCQSRPWQPAAGDISVGKARQPLHKVSLAARTSYTHMHVQSISDLRSSAYFVAIWDSLTCFCCRCNRHTTHPCMGSCHTCI